LKAENAVCIDNIKPHILLHFSCNQSHR